MIEEHKIVDCASWLARRRKDVTASVAPALLCAEPITPFQLWADKSDLACAVEDTPSMLRGRRLQSVTLEILSEEHPEWNIWDPHLYLRDPAARIGATPDAFAVDPQRPGRGVVQVKSVEPSVFRAKWRDAEGNVECPLWIAVQTLVEATLAGADWACVAALVVGHGADVHVVDVPLVPAVFDRLRDRVAEFWEMVARKEPPPPDFARDGAAIAWMNRNPSEELADWSDWNEAPELAAEYHALGNLADECETRRKAIKAQIDFKLGSAECAKFGDKIFARRRIIARKGYTVAPTEYSKLAILWK